MDVLEGENAAFCVEVEEEEMDIHWYKEGVELRETHQTILKSFGRTHILVFVNTMPQDSGQVTFFVGRSKTSSQLRVKGNTKWTLWHLCSFLRCIMLGSAFILCKNSKRTGRPMHTFIPLPFSNETTKMSSHKDELTLTEDVIDSLFCVLYSS